MIRPSHHSHKTFFALDAENPRPSERCNLPIFLRRSVPERVIEDVDPGPACRLEKQLLKTWIVERLHLRPTKKLLQDRA